MSFNHGNHKLISTTNPQTFPASADDNPGPLLEAVYREIYRDRMAGLPIVNPALEVEAYDFARFGGFWLGVLITPWFMNLILLPGESPLPQLAEGKSQSWLFPCGSIRFVAGFENGVGPHQVCSLFSPMGVFPDQAQARAAAKAALETLSTASGQAAPEVPAGQEADGVRASKRNFLRSFIPGGRRESGR